MSNVFFHSLPQFLSFNFNHQINTLTGFNANILPGKQRTIFCPEILSMVTSLFFEVIIINLLTGASVFALAKSI